MAFVSFEISHQLENSESHGDAECTASLYSTVQVCGRGWPSLNDSAMSASGLNRNFMAVNNSNRNFSESNKYSLATFRAPYINMLFLCHNM